MTSRKLVHAVKFAQQPDILILCTEENTTPAWNQPEPEHGEYGIYMTDNGQWYSFDAAHVTCESCKERQ